MKQCLMDKLGLNSGVFEALTSRVFTTNLTTKRTMLMASLSQLTSLEGKKFFFQARPTLLIRNFSGDTPSSGG